MTAYLDEFATVVSYKMRATLAVLLLALLAAPAAQTAAVVPATGCAATCPTVSTTGTASTTTPAERATVSFSVVTLGGSAVDAERDNALASTNVAGEVTSLAGVSEQNFSFVAFTLSEVINATTGEITGYTATHAAQVVVDPLLVPGVIDAVVQAGATRIDGVTYDISDATRSKLYSEQLTAASANAFSRAAAIVAALPQQAVGQALSLSENAPFVPMPMAAFALAPSVNSFAPGPITVTASVAATFALVPALPPMAGAHH